MSRVHDLKRAPRGRRRYFNTAMCDGRLADGTTFLIGAENDARGGIVVFVGEGDEAYLLPYAAIVKALELERGG